MTRLTDLPEELLLQLAPFFYLDDLRSISLTCSTLNKAVYKRLQYHVNLKRQYNSISDRSWTAQQHRLGWFDVLAELLRHDFPAEYVTRLRITSCPWYWGELYSLSSLTSAETRRPYKEDDMNIVVRAALSSPWIYRNGTKPCGGASNAQDMSQFVTEVKEGDMDNILAILLPLLPDLEHIDLGPGVDQGEDEDQPRAHWLGSIPGIVHRIATQSHDPSRKHELLSLQNPAPYRALENLRSVRFDFTVIAQIMPWATTFLELALWMALPSLRRIDAINVNETMNHFSWPCELPHSNVQDIRFYSWSRSLPLQEAVKLARCCVGPCLITQRDLRGNLIRPEDTMWDWQAVRVAPTGSIMTLGGVLP